MAPANRPVGPAEPPALLGGWSLDRRLADRRLGLLGRVTGHLEVSERDDGLRWFESGRLTWSGQQFPVTRELWLRPDGPGWQVCFSDGRPFHPWRTDMVVEHPCRADLYRGLIRLDRDGTRLRTMWDVLGPAKNQRLLTRCRRIPV